MSRPVIKCLTLLAILCSGIPASAQLSESTAWNESAIPPPPTFDESRLVAVEMPVYSRLSVGVDPQTLRITDDGVVRYVVVARSQSGSARNVFYEGVRCATNEMKTYARFNNGQWESTSAPQWRPIALMNSRHTQALALQGLCHGRAPRLTAADMVRELKQPSVSP